MFNTFVRFFHAGFYSLPFVILFCAVASTGADVGQVVTQLTVPEIAGIARNDWPLRAGLPLLQGLVKDPASLALVDPTMGGKHLPLQARVLTRWRDGSIKWILLDTRVNLQASQTLKINLVTQPTPSTESSQQSPQLVTQHQGQVTANTGFIRVRFTEPGNRESLAKIDLDRNHDGTFDVSEQLPGGLDAMLRLQTQSPGAPDQENWLRDAGNDLGTIFLAQNDKDRTIQIEESGTEHAIVRIDGFHVSQTGQKVFPYTLRIHFYNGSNRLHFQHTFTASEDVTTNFLRELSVNLPGSSTAVTNAVLSTSGKEKTIRLSSDARRASLWSMGDPRFYNMVSWRQPKAVHAWIGVENATGSWAEESVGTEPPGWLSAVAENGVTSVGFKEFSRMHPKELSVDSTGKLSVFLWPAHGKKCLDLRRRSTELRADLVENDWDIHQGRGIAVTHEWFVEYAAKNADAVETGSSLALAASTPLILVAPPEYIARTQTFGEFLPTADASFARLSSATDFGVRYLRRIRTAYGLDGMIDWGDVPIAGVGAKDHIGNVNPEGIPFQGYNGWNNNDMSLAHGLFVHYLRTGDPKVFADAAAMTRHVMDIDTIHWYPENPAQLGQGRRHDQQHWGNGARGYCYAPYASIDLYLLTGDRRAYDVAKEMADNPTLYGRYITIRFWEITGEEKYKKAAEEFLKIDLSKIDGEWPFEYGRNFRSNSYDGVGYTFYDSIAPNEPLSRAIVRSLDAVADKWRCAWDDPGHPAHALAAMAHQKNPTEINTEALKAMVWSLMNAKIPDDASLFALSDDAPIERFIEVNNKTLQIGRTDMFALYYLVGLPQVLARLHAVGVNEDQCRNLEWKWVDRPSFTETFDPKKIRFIGLGRKDFNHEYDYYTLNASPSYRPDTRLPESVQKSWAAAIRRTRFYEDGRLMGPHPFPRAQMERDGYFGWSRRLSNALSFTTSDNSDPRTNKRVYSLVYTSEADEKWKDVPAFAETLDPNRIRPFGPSGHVWAYMPQHNVPQRVALYPERPDDVRRFNESRRRQNFSIEGVSQGPMYSKDEWGDFFRGEAKGWGVTQNLLMFDLPPGVDPRKDGRTYLFTYSPLDEAR